jgi:hypothetical protein
MAALIFSSNAAGDERPELSGGEPDPASAQIIEKYIQATESTQSSALAGSIQMDIRASLPKLQKSGHLRALKKISAVGHNTYRVLAFQGDNTVKKEVIARYLQVDQSADRDPLLAVTPANYKLKFTGERSSNLGRDVYVFQVLPRKRRVGLFKGELWLDAQTCLPVYERGRLVKNPSIFFKRVDFERAYTIRDGIAIPDRFESTIEARMVGRVQLSVEYSDFSPASVEQPETALNTEIAEASQ